MTKNQSTPLGGPYGRRLYVDVVDETAKADPDRPWIYVPRTSSAKDGWKVLTWGQHANAVNRTANWLVEKLGKPEHKSFPSIAYVGPNDARYIVLFAAGVKAGYQVGTSGRIRRFLANMHRSCSRLPATILRVRCRYYK